MRRLGLLLLLLVSGLIASLFVGADVAQAAPVSDTQNGNKLILNLDFSGQSGTYSHRLDYKILSTGSCPTWTFNGSNYDKVALGSSTSGRSRYTHLLNLATGDEKVCVWLVWRSPMSILTHNTTAHVVPVDTRKPTITVTNGTPNNFTFSATADESVHSYSWLHLISSDGSCQQNNFGDIRGRGSSFTVQNSQLAQINGSYICFFATDYAGNVGGGSKRISLDVNLPDPPIPPFSAPAPTPNVTTYQNPEDNGDIFLTAAADQNIRRWTWANVSSTSNCQTFTASQYFNALNPVGAGRKTAVKTFDSSKAGDWICVRAQSAASLSVYGYAGPVQLQSNPPACPPACPPPADPEPSITVLTPLPFNGSNVTIHASSTPTTLNINQWWAVRAQASTTCSHLSHGHYSSHTMSIRSPNPGSVDGQRTASKSYPQSAATTPYNWVCIKVEAANRKVDYEKVKLRSQGQLSLTLSQWQEGPDKIRIQARTSGANEPIDTGSGGRWQERVNSGSAVCSGFSSSLMTGSSPPRYTTLYSTSNLFDPSPAAPASQDYICVKATHADGRTVQKTMAIMRLPEVESLNAIVEGVIRGYACTIRFVSLTVKPLGLDTNGDVEIRTPGRFKLVSSVNSVNGTSLPVQFDVNDRQIIDLDGANAAQMTIARGLVFSSSQYYYSGVLKNYQNADYSATPPTTFDIPMTINQDLSGLSSDCSAPVPPTSCTLSSLPDFSNISGPGSNSGRSQTRSVSSTIAGSTQSWSHSHTSPPYDHDGDPNTPDISDPPVTHSGSYQSASSVSDTITVQFSSYGSLSETVAEGLASLLALNGDAYGVDTASSLTGSSHSVKLKPSFDTSTIDSTLESTGSSVTSTSNNSSLWVSDSVTRTVTLTITNHKARPEPSGSWISNSANKSNGSELSLTRNSSQSSGTVITYLWELDWTMTIKEDISVSYSWSNHKVGSYSDGGTHYYDYSQAGSGSWSPSNTVTYSGKWKDCSRTLIVQPPNCRISYSPRFNEDFYSDEIQEETFDPNTPGGTSYITEDKMFPVGRPFSRTRMTVVNHNPFDLSATPTYSITAASAYASGNNPYSGQSADISTQGVSPGGSTDYNETKKKIDLPGKYDTTWTVSWRSDTGSYPSSDPWAGNELSSTTCASGSQLSQFVYVYAEPPTCHVNSFLFEIGSRPVTKVTLYNPNHAPMTLRRADWSVERHGTRYGNGSEASGQQIPKATDANGDGSLEVSGDFASPPITGEFTALWTIRTDMGNEAWTSWDSNTSQNSWFEDRNERIDLQGTVGEFCKSEGNKVVHRPFVKVFYGSLVAGGHFGTADQYDACGENFAEALVGSSSVNFVAGHTEGSTSADARGSSVELALQANDAIKGFYSASQRSSSPTPLKGLTLSNEDPSLDYGGSFGQRTCLANYWRDVEQLTPEANPSPLTLDLRSLQSNDRKLYVLDPTETLEIIDSASASLELKATIYVEGNVRITGDIINNDTGNMWYDPSDIGYLAIIVQGDIEIAPNVERIDALLVAYPRQVGGSTQGGRISTCHYYGVSGSVLHFGMCNRQLTVNGALVAEKVLFGRTYGSVLLETNFPAGPGNTEAAEIINLIPEYFVSIPELPLFPDQIYKIDSLSSRPSNF